MMIRQRLMNAEPLCVCGRLMKIVLLIQYIFSWRCMANVPVIIHLNRYGKGYHARMLAVLLNKGTVYSSDLLVVPKVNTNIGCTC